MSYMNSSPASDRFKFLKWVSEQNKHIPMSELEFMLGTSSTHEDEIGEYDNFLSLDPKTYLFASNQAGEQCS